MMRPRNVYRAFATWVVCAAAITLTRPAEAHAIGLSRGEYHVTTHGVEVTIVLARAEVAAAFPSLDSAKDGVIASELLAKILVTKEDAPCQVAFDGARLTEQDGFEARAHYVCREGSSNLTVTLAPLLDELSHGHRHAARVVAGSATTEHLLFRRHAAFDVDGAEAAVTRASSSSQRWGFVRMGVEHILTGYDHLLFLFALVLAGGTLRSLAGAVTAFTVAHTLTLGLSVLGFVSPPARFIEPAIALSVAYVGVENFFARAHAGYRTTFAFGLLHGFGFAGALGDASIPSAEVPWALFSFNAGVEIGQLLWMVVLASLVTALRRFEWFGRRAVFVLSAAIAVAGLVWFVGRVRDPALVTYAANFGLWRG
jgi:hydrogenase/urease accessory protein HupE